MSDRVRAPLIIAITGRRDLRGKEEAVRAALIACFNLLDRQFPTSPKIFLSGLAAGADMIGAKAAVERQNWRLIAVLPFAPELYEQDFDQAQLADFRGLLKKNGVRSIVLDPLRDPATGQAYSPSALSRSLNTSTSVRSRHYEQLGLYIAERATLLIGIMPADERPGKVGGTARIVDVRIHGNVDATASRVIEASTMLRQRQPIDDPQPGPVWLIDLNRVSAATRPLDSVQLWRPKLASASAKFKVDKIACTREMDLARPLQLAAGMEAFNRRVMQVSDEEWKRKVTARASTQEDPASSALSRLRLAFATIQGNDKQNLKGATATLALLFVVGVLSLEVFIASDSTLILGVYLCLLLISLLVFSYARFRRWQQYAEDYRAIAEALRVQLAWWGHGLATVKDRVDRIYLFGATGSLGLVRAAIRHLIDAVLLENGPPTAVPDKTVAWIKGQIGYFTQRVRERQQGVGLNEDIVWFLFVASVSMAVGLLTQIGPVVLKLGLKPSWFGGGITVLFLFAMFWGLHHFSRLARQCPNRGERLFLQTLSLVFAASAGLFFATAVFYFAPWIADIARRTVSRGIAPHLLAGCTPDLPNDCTNMVGTKLVLMLATVIASIAGALRFYVEILAFEPELHQYREALVIFQRAYDELSKTEADRSDHARRQRERIVISLGERALAENEAWIRAHRVRPLEPHL